MVVDDEAPTASQASHSGNHSGTDAAANDPLSLSHVLKIPGTKHLFDNCIKTIMDKLSHYPTFAAPQLC